MPTQKIEYLGFTLKSKRHDSHCNKKKRNEKNFQCWLNK